jgi:hypothetical protein
MYNPRQWRRTRTSPCAIQPPLIQRTTWRDLLLEQGILVDTDDPDDGLDEYVSIATDVDSLSIYIISVIRTVRISLLESVPMVACLDSGGNRYHRTPREALDDCRVWLQQYHTAYPPQIGCAMRQIARSMEDALETETAEDLDEVLEEVLESMTFLPDPDRRAPFFTSSDWISTVERTW